MPTTAPTETRPTRPLLATVLAWVLIVSGVSALFSILFLLAPSAALIEVWEAQGLDASAMLLTNLVLGTGSALSGWGLLHAQAWSRPLYVAVSLIGLASSAAVLGSSTLALAFGGAWYGFFVFLLYRPSVTAYVEGTYELSDEAWRRVRALRHVRKHQRNPNDLMRVFGVLLAIGSGFFLLMAMMMYGLGGRAGAALMLVVGIPALGALGLAVALWGARRWRALCGWTLLGAGVWGALTGLYILALSHMEEWRQMMGDADMPLSDDALLAIGLAGAMVTVVGAALVHQQRQLDHDAADELIADRDATT